MADVTVYGNDFLALPRKYKDQGDGTYAEVVYNGAADPSLGLPGLVVPQMISGMGTSGSVTMVAARATYGRFVPPRNMTITLAAFATTVAATNDDPFEIAVYDATTLTQLATTASAGATGILNSAAGVKTLPLSVTLVAGRVYYLGCMCLTVGGTSASFMSVAFNANAGSDLFGAVTPKRILAFQSGVATALPGTALLTSPQNAMPAIALRES